MTTPTYRDAMARATVRLPDGRTATLTYVPGGKPRRGRDHGGRGGKATVRLPSGRHLSIHLDQLQLVPDAEEA